MIVVAVGDPMKVLLILSPKYFIFFYLLITWKR